jgi:ABC-type dipeptide/oligopeptide/nickel transport system permease component
VIDVSQQEDVLTPQLSRSGSTASAGSANQANVPPSRRAAWRAGPASVARFLLGRLGQGVFVLFGAVTISFLLTNAVGKPADVIGGLYMSEEQRATLNAQMGYDQPLVVRFLHYIGGVLTGDFGVSYRTKDSAGEIVLSALPNTLLLVLTALLTAGLIATPLAIFSARKRDVRRDWFLRRSIGVLQGLPDFWLALMLILVFSVQLNLMPSFGFTSYASLVLPALALGLPIVPTLFRLFRGQLLDVLGNEFVEAMRARGLSERVIVYRHGIRNTAGPAATLVALQIGYLIVETIIVETVFSWPGIGNLLVSSVQARDFAVVQTIIIVVAAFYVLINLIADAVLVFSDPRVRRGGA